MAIVGPALLDVGMLASGPLYDSGTLWGAAGAIAGFAAIVVSLLLWRLGAPRRLLGYSTPAISPMLSERWTGLVDDPVEMSIHGHPLIDPHVLVLRVVNKSRKDIRSADFDQGQPLVFDLRAHVVAMANAGSSLDVTEVVQVEHDRLMIGPTLIPGGKGLKLTLITEGHPVVTVKSPIAGVKVRALLPEGTNWRELLIVMGASASGIALSLGIISLGLEKVPRKTGDGIILVVTAVLLLAVTRILTSALENRSRGNR